MCTRQKNNNNQKDVRGFGRADERRAAVEAWMREDGAYPYSGCPCHPRRAAGTISIDEYDEQRSPANGLQEREEKERERGL